MVYRVAVRLGREILAAMSRENVEIVRGGYDTMNGVLGRDEIDRSLIAEMWTTDCVLRPSGLLPESAEMRGHAGIERFVRIQMEAFDALRIEPLEFVDAGDAVVVPIRFGGRARHTGMEVTFEVVHVWTLRGGKFARLDMFVEKRDALEAVGLRE